MQTKATSLCLLEYLADTGAEGADLRRDLRLRPSRRELTGTRREAQFERSGAGRTRLQRAQKGRIRTMAGWGAEAMGQDPRAENSAALRSGAPGRRTEKARRGHWGTTRRTAGRTLRLTEGSAEAETRGRSQGKDYSQGKGRAAERLAPNTAAGATTEKAAELRGKTTAKEKQLLRILL